MRRRMGGLGVSVEADSLVGNGVFNFCIGSSFHG